MEVAELHFRVMASQAHVMLSGGSPRAAELAATVDFLAFLESRWSRFLGNSDITRLNNAEGRPVRVDPNTVTLVRHMVDAWRVTEGRFDPTVLPILVAAGYDTSIVDDRHVTILPSARSRPDQPLVDDLDSVVIDPGRNIVALSAGLAIDPGGIGKGLAADLAVARLLDMGARGALVSIGGDLAMGGWPPAMGVADTATDGAADSNQAWMVEVAHPARNEETLCTLAVSAGGVATSSTLSRRWLRDGRARHHIIDAARGEQSHTDLDSVTVAARSGWLAEAHATAAILVGRDHVANYFSEHDLSGIALSSDSSPIVSADLAGQPLVGFDDFVAAAANSGGRR